MSAVNVSVRLFAGAAEAVGRESAVVELPAGDATIGGLVAALIAAGGPESAHVLGRCSFLVAGVRADSAETALSSGATIDVLPPFAGG